MDTWQLFLLIGGVAGFVFMWAFAVFSMKKSLGIMKVLWVGVALFLVVAVCTVALQQVDASNKRNWNTEALGLIDSNNEKFPDTDLIKINRADLIYLAYRANGDGNVYLSALCDLFGTDWIELGQLTDEETPENGENGENGEE